MLNRIFCWGQRIYAFYIMLQMRRGWHNYRMKLGYPISWHRAMFGEFPRFGSFLVWEAGCSMEHIKMYQAVAREELKKVMQP